MSNDRTSPIKFFIGAAIFISLCAGGLTYYYSGIGLVGSYLIGINVALLLLCGFDKSIAGGKSLRVPENVFFAFALLGGSLGMLLGMHLFRHKTKKASFQIILVLILVLQIIILQYARKQFGLF